MERNAFACPPGGVALPGWNPIRGEFLQGPRPPSLPGLLVEQGQSSLSAAPPRHFVHNLRSAPQLSGRVRKTICSSVMTTSPFISLTSNTLSHTSRFRTATVRLLNRRLAHGQGNRAGLVRHGCDITAPSTSARQATPVVRPSSTILRLSTSLAQKSMSSSRIISCPRIPGGCAVVCSCP